MNIGKWELEKESKPKNHSTFYYVFSFSYKPHFFSFCLIYTILFLAFPSKHFFFSFTYSRKFLFTVTFVAFLFQHFSYSSFSTFSYLTHFFLSSFFIPSIFSFPQAIFLFTVTFIAFLLSHLFLSLFSTFPSFLSPSFYSLLFFSGLFHLHFSFPISSIPPFLYSKSVSSPVSLSFSSEIKVAG